MRCPFCASSNIKVLDTRESETDSTRRRRECLDCNKRFTTYEKIEGTNITVIKRDGSKQAFNIDKLKKGVNLACQKRLSNERIEEIIENIEMKIRSLDSTEVKSTKIGSIVLKTLKKADPVAYLRFASIYRNFKEYKSFEKEIENLKKAEKKVKKRNTILQLRKRNGSIALFDQMQITESIIRAMTAAGEVDPELANALSDEVVLFLENQFDSPTIITIEEIQDASERILIENNHVSIAKEYILQRQTKRKATERESVFIDVTNTISDYVKQRDWRVRENSNEAFSLSGLMLYTSSKIIANYTLNEVYTPAISEAHKKGYYHIHDLSHGIVGYCAGWSLKNLLLWGLGGVPNKSDSKPAKHLRVVVNHMVNYIGCLQMEFAGAQAFSSVDTLLSAFVKSDELNYKETKQCMQELVFSLNIPSRWGSQYPFSNLTFDWVIPDDMRNEKAIVGGKEQDFTYGDCQKEMDMVNKAFLEVMLEGDAKGAIFSFPIPTYNLTKDFDWDSDNANLLFKMTAKYGTPYFQNYIGSDMDPKSIRAMCCRLNINMLELTRRPGHIFAMGDNTGSVGVVTLNMNRMGYEANTKEEFHEKVAHYMDLAKESLEIKRKIIQQNMDNNLVPYTKRYLGHYNNHFSTIGLVGMNEAAMNFIGKSLATKEGKEFAIETLKFMRDRLIKYQRETGNLYNLEATPAEGCSYRLARLDKKMHGDKIYTSGKDFPYLTNSTHLPVDFSDDAVEALEHQNDIQILYTGGTIFHTFLGERMTDGNTCKALVKKIAYNTKIPYFSITPTFSICKEHGYISGEHFNCPVTIEQKEVALAVVGESGAEVSDKKEVKTCGLDCEVYSRIVGYYRPVQRWHDGKQEEFKFREAYRENKSLSHKFPNEKTGTEPDKEKLTAHVES